LTGENCDPRDGFVFEPCVQEEVVTKSIFALVTMAAMATACGSSDSTEVSAAAAPPPPAVEAPAAETAKPAAPEFVAAPAAEPAKAAPQRRPAARPAAPAAPARSESVAAAPAPAVPEYREFTVPAGTTLSLELKSAVASDVSEVEDTVRATLRQPMRVNGEEVLPAGTELAGTVTEVERAGRVKGRARVAFRFTSLRYDGERLPVQTEAIEQVAEATKGEDATKIGVGAGAGAVIGGILGGKAGAAKGAAIGGAAGTGAVLATRGKEVRLEPGAEVPATLAAPLVVRVRLQ
jgi:hypothetical protein